MVFQPTEELSSAEHVPNREACAAQQHARVDAEGENVRNELRPRVFTGQHAVHLAQRSDEQTGWTGELRGRGGAEEEKDGASDCNSQRLVGKEAEEEKQRGGERAEDESSSSSAAGTRTACQTRSPGRSTCGSRTLRRADPIARAPTS